MSEKTNTPQEAIPEEDSQQYTEAEMREMRKKMLTHYKEEITFFKAQEQYERLLADIEDHKLRKFIAMAQVARIFAQADAAEQEALDQKQKNTVKMEPSQPKIKRKLKTESDV
jgi:hypothetical protein